MVMLGMVLRRRLKVLWVTERLHWTASMVLPRSAPTKIVEGFATLLC